MPQQLEASASLAEKPYVEHIHIAAIAGGPMVSLSEVEVTRGRGLAGDRYSEGLGFWRDARVSRDLTLVEGEVIDAVSEILGPIEPGTTRRNLTTRGVKLDDLAERTFWIGKVLVKGRQTCSPCQHLVEVTGKPLLRPLARRGGLRADLLSSGRIRVGDAISVVEEQIGVGRAPGCLDAIKRISECRVGNSPLRRSVSGLG